ncbi:MAG TPA: hypothetical protein VF667_05130, partial [Pseudonocardia sp.]
HAAVQLAGAAVRGPGWFARGDPFEVYSTMIARLCPFARRDGRAVLRNPLVATAPVPPGAAAFVAVWWGSTVVDSTSSSTAWGALVQRVGGPVLLGPTLLGTVLLVLVCAAVAGSIALVTRSGDMTPALVPVAVGYTVAHYFSLLVVEGQRGLLLAVGSTVEPWRPAPAAVAAVQVAAVLLGHVAGVVAAHDRALVTTPAAGPARPADELPLVLLMVGYTLVGLTLLFAA